MRNSEGVREKYTLKTIVWVQRKMRLVLLMRRKWHAYYCLALKLRMCQRKTRGAAERGMVTMRDTWT